MELAFDVSHHFGTLGADGLVSSRAHERKEQRLPFLPELQGKAVSPQKATKGLLAKKQGALYKALYEKRQRNRKEIIQIKKSDEGFSSSDFMIGIRAFWRASPMAESVQFAR